MKKVKIFKQLINNIFCDYEDIIEDYFVAAEFDDKKIIIEHDSLYIEIYRNDVKCNGNRIDFPSYLNKDDISNMIDEVFNYVEVASLTHDIDLSISNGIEIEDVEPGEKCNDGGEYGFYTIYESTPVPGLYRISTTTTCDFDSCGTGFEEYKWMCIDDMFKVIDAAEKEGKRILWL